MLIPFDNVVSQCGKPQQSTATHQLSNHLQHQLSKLRWGGRMTYPSLGDCIKVYVEQDAGEPECKDVRGVSVHDIRPCREQQEA